MPSLLRPGSNSKRARALLELREGDSTWSGVGEALVEVSTGSKEGLEADDALMVGGDVGSIVAH